MRLYPEYFTEKQRADFDEIRAIAKSLENVLSIGVTDDNPYLAFIQVDVPVITDELLEIERKFNSLLNDHKISLTIVLADFEEGDRIIPFV